MGAKTIGRKGHKREKPKNEVNTLKEVSPSEDSSLASAGDGFTSGDEHDKKKTKRLDDGGDFEISYSQNEVVNSDISIDADNNKMEKDEKTKRKIEWSVKAGKKDRVSDNGGGNVFEGKKGPEKEDIAKMSDGEEDQKEEEEEEEEEKEKKKKKKAQKQKTYQVIKSVINGKETGNGRGNLDENIVNEVQSLRKERKNKKKKHNIVLEAASAEIMAETLGNERTVAVGDGGNTDSRDDEVRDGKLEVSSRNIEGKNRVEKRRKKRKRDKNSGDVLVMNGGTGGKEVVNGTENVYENLLENDEYLRKERKKKKKEEKKKNKKKKKRHHVDLEAASLEIVDEKLGSESNLMGENEWNTHSTKSNPGGTRVDDHTINAAGGNNVKKKKAKSKKNGSEGKGSKRVPRIEKAVETTDPSESSAPKGTSKSKRVSFSEDVEVFPSTYGPSNGKTVEEQGLVRGKRFSYEEDEMVKEAVFNYINAHGLGEEGLKMVMNCKKHPEVKNCWKEIGAALPWRPVESVYYRAHILFERGEKHSWTPEEYELVRKFHEKHGADWKTLADALGKHRFHVKDTWRRIKFDNRKRGHWSQEEYQTLFDLVNMDLRMKAFEEKKSKHGMLRDNISWTAISGRLETRTDALCCMKWYDQLTSPMVAEGIWLDTDDYHLLIALYDVDACCMEDVDWDCLLEHRSGAVCRKRWNQMVKHLGEHGNKSFADQVDVLIKRYCPDMLEVREAYDSKPAVS